MANVSTITGEFSPISSSSTIPTAYASGSSVVGEPLSRKTTYSMITNPTVAGLSGSQTTTQLNCPSCCKTSKIRFLPSWFSFSYDQPLTSPDGLCAGLVDNTKPVTVYATFNFYPYTPYTLSDYCIPSSGTVELIADTPTDGMIGVRYLRVKNPTSQTCATETPPNTRFLYTGGKIESLRYFPNYSVFDTGFDPMFLDAVPPQSLCDCFNRIGESGPSIYLTTRDKYVDGQNQQNTFQYVGLKLLSYSCDPFYITYGKDIYTTTPDDNLPIFVNWYKLGSYTYPFKKIGYWTVTFTL